MSADFRLATGAVAPGFELLNHLGETVAVPAKNGLKTIAYFFPAAGSPGCTKEAVDLQDNLAQFTQLGYQIVGISPDSPERLDDFVDSHQLEFQLLSDPELEAHKSWGAFGEKNLYGRIYRGVIRSTIVIDADGVVEHALYNVKATGHANMLLRKLGA